ncbi:adenylosuccinate synthetase [Candidatus Falkowbacteria bacterium]|nr:adenylosuccinate synthetase [Candidatus Falkowbacteria bacterium]
MERPPIFIECDLGFGDAGKGTITDFLCRAFNIPLVIRFNGGPQAGHYVVLPDGRYHCFAHFGSGTFVEGVRTLLSRKMLIKPDNLLVEEKFLRRQHVTDAFSRLTIDSSSPIITPYHQMICQIHEIARGENRQGSCGLGVGQAIQDEEMGIMIYPADIGDTVVLKRKLDEMRAKKMELAKTLVNQSYSSEANSILIYFTEEYPAKKLLRAYKDFELQHNIAFDDVEELIKSAVFNGTPMLFEGAQGALLDKTGGFQPFVTKSRATFHNVNILLGQRIDQKLLKERFQIQKIGIMRPYAHRHGAGPLVTEDSSLLRYFSDHNNQANRWQGMFRVGWLDLLAIRYGIMLNGGVDWIALTNLDKLTSLPTIRICVSYEYRGAPEPSVLNPFCEWRPLANNRAEILAIKKARYHHSTIELTRILQNCRPLRFVDCPGWDIDISGASDFDDLPSQAKFFLTFLESEKGLNVPIKLVSVNPTYTGKFFTQ